MQVEQGGEVVVLDAGVGHLRQQRLGVPGHAQPSRAMKIAADICVYTNDQLVIETIVKKYDKSNG